MMNKEKMYDEQRNVNAVSAKRGNNPLFLTVALLQVLRFYPLVLLLDRRTNPCKILEAGKLKIQSRVRSEWGVVA